ncbi:hypothetical protein TH66_19565 [Carbonactinospora thermoautotrophica]|uniref:Uncharacterized protein n=1 Tax=Carbonactinospora thermoautotrophica TaxID=1469144 RepID=A0A132N7N1_9ACTN|nr:hypothetical protein TH66_19565 [Carbonactinospora thermoautotrophica]KWX06161.1 hypothetical protein TR74_22880 [Carbonactinospora thermoautotrophica]
MKSADSWSTPTVPRHVCGTRGTNPEGLPRGCRRSPRRRAARRPPGVSPPTWHRAAGPSPRRTGAPKPAHQRSGSPATGRTTNRRRSPWGSAQAARWPGWPAQVANNHDKSDDLPWA